MILGLFSAVTHLPQHREEEEQETTFSDMHQAFLAPRVGKLKGQQAMVRGMRTIHPRIAGLAELLCPPLRSQRAEGDGDQGRSYLLGGGGDGVVMGLAHIWHCTHMD